MSQLSPDEMFMIGGYRSAIERVTVVRKTERFVTWLQTGVLYNKPYERKQSRDDFFDSWEEARAALVSRADRQITNAQSSLDRAKHVRKIYMEMKP